MFRKKKGADVPGPASDPAEVFKGLRAQILGLDPTAVGLRPSEEHPHVWGALLETGYDQATVTLVSLADGTTSLYTSSGFGIIGGGAHQQVADATTAFLQAVERELDAFAPDSDASVPRVGQTVIRALTFGGRHSIRAPEDDFGHGRHAQSDVFHAAQGVITQLRLIDQQRRG